MVDQSSSNHQQLGITVLWEIKNLIHNKKLSAQNLFNLFNAEKNNSLSQSQFATLLANTINKQQRHQYNLSHEFIQYLFYLISSNKNGILLSEFQQVFDLIDLKKDDPDYYKKKVFKKLELLKQYHLNGQIDMAKLITIFGSTMSMEQFFKSLQVWGTNLNQEEQISLIDALSNNKIANNGIINVDIFLTWMKIPVPQGYKQSGHQNITRQIQQPQKIIPQMPQQSTNSDIQYINPIQQTLSQSKWYTIEGNDVIQNIDKFIQIFEENLKQNKCFEDTHFPAKIQSLYESNSQRLGEWDDITWLKPDFFFKGAYQMFSVGDSNLLASRIGLGKLISPYDILQGGLGDCYFLSAISSLAQDPLRILNLFITRLINPISMYCVKICKNGEFEAIWIDDQIPCINQKPSFTKASSNEIWVLLLEKAWAKVWNSYERIESGQCRDALRDLTGAPTLSLSVEEDGKLNPNLYESLKKAFLNSHNKWIVTCGSDDQLTQSTADKKGLVVSHAYSIINMYEVTHPQKGKVTLLKLRNPWGKKDWKGDWGEDSPLWTEQLKIELHHKKIDCGIFFIEFRDFIKYFSDVAICHYYDFFHYSSKKVSSNSKNSIYFEVIINTPGPYYFTINQISKRQYPRNYDYDYSVSRILIIKQDKDQIYYIGGKLKKDKETWFGDYLSQGKYLIQTKVFWSKQSGDFVLSSYGPKNISLQKINKQPIFDSYIQKAVLNNIERQKPEFTNYSWETQLFKHIHLDLNDGYGYLIYKNEGIKSYQINVEFNKMINFKPKKPYRGTNFELILQPSDQQLIIFTLSAKGYSYNIKENFQQLQ